MNFTLSLDDDVKNILLLQKKFNETRDTTEAFAYLSAIIEIASEIANKEYFHRELETYRKDMIYKITQKRIL